MFAWEPEDTPAGKGGTYTMLRRAGRDVAGMYELSPDMLERGVPPHWLSYVTVADIVTYRRARARARRNGRLGPVRGHGCRRHGGDPRPPGSVVGAVGA